MHDVMPAMTLPWKVFENNYPNLPKTTMRVQVHPAQMNNILETFLFDVANVLKCSTKEIF